MISLKARLFLRLMPRAYLCTPTPAPRLNASLLQSCNGVHSACSSNSVKGLLLEPARTAGACIVSKRSLAGGHTDDYILHENTLTESEKKEIDSSVKKDFEDWIPYGYDPTDKEEDIFRHKMFLFSTITLGVVVFLYLLVHVPPRNKRDWITREAYLELERRQRLGLPLVDKNLIPADQILLPSLEELGDDYDIII